MKWKRLYNAIFVFPIVSIAVIIISFGISAYLLEITKVDHYISTTIETTDQFHKSVCKIPSKDFPKVKDKGKLVLLYDDQQYKIEVLEYYKEDNCYYVSFDSARLGQVNQNGLDVKLYSGKCSLLSLMFK